MTTQAECIQGYMLVKTITKAGDVTEKWVKEVCIPPQSKAEIRVPFVTIELADDTDKTITTAQSRREQEDGHTIETSTMSQILKSGDRQEFLDGNLIVRRP